MELVGRHRECALLDGLIEAVRAGESRALVLSGEAGVGKTALLDYLAGRAAECRVEGAGGVQSEMELPFAALHQLCAPMLGKLQGLPAPQRDALEIAFGLSSGSAPDRFLVGLALLSLLSDVAEKQPLVCVVDDEQWLDRASAQVLGFVARRLGAESVGLIFAARVPSSDIAGLPDLVVERLGDTDARALLDAALTAPLDARVRDQILAETRGNPLALLELPRGLTPQELAGGFGLPSAALISCGVEENFRRRVDVLPDQTRRLLLIAAAEPLGDPALVWVAAALLGIGAEADGAGDRGGPGRLRHAGPVSPSPRALGGLRVGIPARTTDKCTRRWRRSPMHTRTPIDARGIAPMPPLGRTRPSPRSWSDRGPGASAWAAWPPPPHSSSAPRSLTLDPIRRTERALAAASAQIKAGAFAAARELLSIAEAGSPSDFQQARIELMEAELAFLTDHGSEAPPILLKAARRLEPIDAELSRRTYLQALTAGYFAGRLAAGDGALEVARAAATAPSAVTTTARTGASVWMAWSAHYTKGYAAGLPILREALHAFGAGMSVDEALPLHSVAGIVARYTWDDRSWQVLSERHVQLARSVGALSELPVRPQCACIHAAVCW